MHIPFEKYKRVFAFGCSFTSYIYPTWADILASEMPNAEYYNFGLSGAGNMFIAARVIEANRRFKFTETDLIMIMYSTSFREDRYIDNAWQGPGHIYNQSYYPMKTFVYPYCQPRGMLLKDLAMIEASSSYIRSLPCGNVLLRSTAVLDEAKDALTFVEEETIDIVALYKELLDSFPPNMYDTEFPNGWKHGVKYINDGKLVEDAHPTPQNYYNYLSKIGINLSELSKKYIDETNEKLNRCIGKDMAVDFPREFPEGCNRRDQARIIMF